jgi:hypothetical protein
MLRAGIGGRAMAARQRARDSIGDRDETSTCASTSPRCPLFVKQSRRFLYSAVVIGVQCMSIRDCIVPRSPSHHARRTVWRRKRSRRPSQQRRRLRRRQGARRPRRSRSDRRGRDWRLECQTLRRTGRRGREPASTGLRPSDPPPIVDDGGRRRERGSAFTRCSASRRPTGRRHARAPRRAAVVAHDRSRAQTQAAQASREAQARTTSRAAIDVALRSRQLSRTSNISPTPSA